MIRELLATVHQLQRRQDQLEHRLDQLVKLHYDPRADKLHPDQGTHFGDPPPEPSPAPVEKPLESSPKSKPKGHDRNSLPKTLHRETMVVDIPEAEKLAGGGTWGRIGEEVGEQLDFTPSSLFVRRIVRPKYVVRFDAWPDELVIAELPSEVMPKSKAAPGLVADIINNPFDINNDSHDIPAESPEQIWSKHLALERIVVLSPPPALPAGPGAHLWFTLQSC